MISFPSQPNTTRTPSPWPRKLERGHDQPSLARPDRSLPHLHHQFDDICALLRPCDEGRQDFAEFVDSLAQRDRHALAVQCFHGQVCNGGFSQWFGNGITTTWPR